jgi:colanic acid/amylovoran biosynthesis glycosyltransferase
MTFAYLFERFPSLTQTFCYREVEEMQRQVGSMPVWSLRYPKDCSEDCPKALAESVRYVPDRDVLRAHFSSVRRMIGRFPLNVIWRLKCWGEKPRKYRLYEAAWLGRELQKQGVTHVHTHFAGIGARTAWWLHQLYGITYSFTGHANDMFCPVEDPVSLCDLINDARFVVTVSDFSREWLVRQYPQSSGKIYRVYNGVKLSESPATLERKSVSKIISVGRAIKKKGFQYLVEACALLRDSGLDFQCQIIGGGPLEHELRRKIEKLGLEGVVELMGSLSWEEVSFSLRKASIFSLACVAEDDGGMDNLPTVILEAMDAGLPVVSTRLAAIPEMVNDGATGFLVAENDAHALAKALERLLRDPVMAEVMGQAGHALVQEKFSLPQTVSSLKALIHHALRES